MEACCGDSGIIGAEIRGVFEPRSLSYHPNVKRRSVNEKQPSTVTREELSMFQVGAAGFELMISLSSSSSQMARHIEAS
jgi:hypothetical protein